MGKVNYSGSGSERVWTYWAFLSVGITASDAFRDQNSEQPAPPLIVTSARYGAVVFTLAPPARAGSRSCLELP